MSIIPGDYRPSLPLSRLLADTPKDEDKPQQDNGDNQRQPDQD